MTEAEKICIQKMQTNKDKAFRFDGQRNRIFNRVLYYIT